MGFQCSKQRPSDCLGVCLTPEAMLHVDKLETGKGFELLRQLLTRYDPVHPNMVSHLRCELFGFANCRCNNFQKLVTRLEDIIHLTDRMGQEHGCRPEDEDIATVLYGGFDQSSLSDIF